MVLLVAVDVSLATDATPPSPDAKHRGCVCDEGLDQVKLDPT